MPRRIVSGNYFFRKAFFFFVFLPDIAEFRSISGGRGEEKRTRENG